MFGNITKNIKEKKIKKGTKDSIASSKKSNNSGYSYSELSNSKKSNNSGYSYNEPSNSDETNSNNASEISNSLPDKKPKKKLNDELNKNSDDESDKESDKITINSDNEENNDGKIPIVMIPCHKFKYGDNTEENIKEFKNHYKSCNKCDKTNNNSSDIKELLELHKIIFKEIDDEEEINCYLSYYYEEKNYDHKLKNTIYIFRINNKDHDYNKSFIILWKE